MVERDVILREKMKSVGLFNYKDFYKEGVQWFIDEDYVLSEVKYTEKVTGNQKELEIIWEGVRDLTDYFRKVLWVKILIRRMEDVEVEIDGKKKKANRGEINIEVRGILLKDYNSRWEESTFLRFLRGVYDRYIVPNRVDNMEDRIRDDVRDFRDEMKAYLDLTGRVEKSSY